MSESGHFMVKNRMNTVKTVHVKEILTALHTALYPALVWIFLCRP